MKLNNKKFVCPECGNQKYTLVKYGKIKCKRCGVKYEDKNKKNS